MNDTIEQADLAALQFTDRCDRCPAGALVRFRFTDGRTLDFCGHHSKEYAPSLICAGAWVHKDKR